jgi:hypothetical protein
VIRRCLQPVGRPANTGGVEAAVDVGLDEIAAADEDQRSRCRRRTAPAARRCGSRRNRAPDIAQPDQRTSASLYEAKQQWRLGAAGACSRSCSWALSKRSQATTRRSGCAKHQSANAPPRRCYRVSAAPRERCRGRLLCPVQHHRAHDRNGDESIAPIRADEHRSARSPPSGSERWADPGLGRRIPRAGPSPPTALLRRERLTYVRGRNAASVSIRAASVRQPPDRAQVRQAVAAAGTRARQGVREHDSPASQRK